MKKSAKKGDFKKAAVLLGPILFWWAVISGFPIAFGVSLGFMRWKGTINAPTFAGFNNFVTFFKDSDYYISLFTALWMGGVCMILTMLISFAGALLLERLPRFKGLFRTLWYIPAITSVAAVSQIFLILLDPSKGIINNILTPLGVKAINVNESFSSAVFVIIIYTLWRGVGASMLLWIAGLQSIDRAQYEAASIDGAGYFARLFHITLPGLRPFITYSVITGSISAIQIYEQIAFITGGNPAGRTQTTVFLIMKDFFYSQNFGMAGASSLIMTVIVFAFAFFYLRGQREKIYKEKN